ncbi:MAG: cell division protein FtsQ/DivIB [Myxococcota bacterium]|nr:cell division protein FtsQ/DivIB [Myxococcota bacterium]
MARRTRYEIERRQKSRRARGHYARVQRRKATQSERRGVIALTFALAFGTGFTAGNLNAPTWLAQLDKPSQTLERFSIIGVDQVAASEIARRTGIARSAPLDSVDLAEASRRIESHPWLRAARLRRLPGGDVLAIVDERSPIALLRSGTGEAWQAVDRDGTTFAAVDPADYPDLLRLRSDAATASFEDVAMAIEIAARAEANGVARLDSVVLPTRSDVASPQAALGWRLMLADGGPEVVLGDDTSEKRMERLAELLDARLDAVRSAERIDLRFRDRAILRAADEASAANDKNNRAGESARATSLGERPASA